MRRHRSNRRRKKQSKIIVITSICLLFVMTAGYAAFSTNLNITAKGNVIDTITVSDLKKLMTTSGDGLYIDSVDNERYVYRGSTPNNYIDIEGDVWRIVAIEDDDTLKIIKQESIGRMIYDEPYARSDSTFCVQGSYGSYGENTNSRYGCNVWNKKDGEYTNGNLTGTVTKDATLNTYLNNEYYNSLSIFFRERIISHSFNVGPILWSWTLSNIYESEKSETWVGNVALLNNSDYIKSSLLDNCDMSTNCLDNNYIYDDIISSTENQYFWTLDSVIGRSFLMYDLYKGKNNSSFPRNNYDVYPVVYLSSDVFFVGEGTEEDPYVLK